MNKDLLDTEFETGGFFYEARAGNFIPQKAEQLLNSLEIISCDEEHIDKDAIRSLWKWPVYIYAYKERCVKQGADKKQYDAISVRLFACIRKIVDKAII